MAPQATATTTTTTTNASVDTSLTTTGGAPLSAAEQRKVEAEKKKAEEALKKQQAMEERLGVVKGREANLDPNSDVGKAVTAFSDQVKKFLESKEFANIQPDELRQSIGQRLESVLGNRGPNGRIQEDLMFTAGFEKVGQLFTGEGAYTKLLPMLAAMKTKFDAYVAAKEANDQSYDEFIANRTGMTFRAYNALPSDEARFQRLRVPLNNGVERRTADEMNMSIIEHAQKFPDKYEWATVTKIQGDIANLKAKGQLTATEVKQVESLDLRLKEVQDEFMKSLNGIKNTTDQDVAAKKDEYLKAAGDLNAAIVDKDGNSYKQQAIAASKADYPQATYAEQGQMVDLDFATFHQVKSTQRFSAAKQSAVESLNKLLGMELNPPIDPRIVEAIKNQKPVEVPGIDPKDPSKRYNHLLTAMGLSERDKALLDIVNLTFGEKVSVLQDKRIKAEHRFASSFEQQAVYYAAFVDANKNKEDVSYNSDSLGARRGRAITAFGPYGDRGGFGPQYLEDAVALLKSAVENPETLQSAEGLKNLKKASQEMRLNDALTVAYAYKNGQMHLRDGVFTSRDIMNGVIIPGATGFVLNTVLNWTGVLDFLNPKKANSGGGNSGGGGNTNGSGGGNSY